jgi:hypothetical protein
MFQSLESLSSLSLCLSLPVCQAPPLPQFIYSVVRPRIYIQLRKKFRRPTTTTSRRRLPYETGSNRTTTRLAGRRCPVNSSHHKDCRTSQRPFQHSYLLTIPPSSVEAERPFSSAGVLCTGNHTRLSDGV